MQELISWPVTGTIEPMVIDDTRQAFAARLNEALDDIAFPPKGKGRQQALGDRMGVSQKGARKWLEGESKPEQSKVLKLSSWLQVNFEWLATGNGEKRTVLYDSQSGERVETYKVTEQLEEVIPENEFTSPKDVAIQRIISAIDIQLRAARISQTDATLLKAAAEAVRNSIDPTVQAAVLLMLSTQSPREKPKAPSNPESVKSTPDTNSDSGQKSRSPQAEFARSARSDTRSAAQTEGSNQNEKGKNGT
ncbi:helix-turn-helix domain-containing protein [Paraburkholderia silviterrae]|uniref:helix-turn-helix domain-containing protein n=1 Tax=Paraburkholderia silviterrae TaxID=2528715 RepID=UPI0014051112|nr:helix-turn-helix transcriptional regulator [Paraburkholderia silviterrae]